MKATFLSLGLVLTASLTAADASKILFTATTISVEEAKAVGAAKAVVGEMTVTADAIAFEKETGTLKCDGIVTVRVAGNIVTARDCSIQLTPGDKKLFFLSRGEIQLSSEAAFPAAPTDLVGRASDREKLIMDFRARRQAEPGPNQVSTPTPVTPPANENKTK